jgi:hypothetical protein
MALKKTIILTDSFGDERTFNDAYIKVDHVSGNKQKLSAVLGVYRSVNGPQLTTRQYEFTPSMDGSNFIKQAYEHTKSLPDFSNAQDC